MKNQSKPKFRKLYNNDGYCIFSQSSPYQKIEDPVGLAQIHGYVDEVAMRGFDVFLLSPTISSIPIWPSKVDLHWSNQKDAPPIPDETKMDQIYNRLKTFVESGHDLVKLASERTKQKGMSFFISWRMNELHDIRRGNRSPLQSEFWRKHSEFWISGSNSKSLWGRALDFSYAEVRDYKFELIRELCTQYKIDGLELDFVRFARFFPSTMPLNERKQILTAFIKRIRLMLDKEVGPIPLCVRVQNKQELVEQMGLDLAECVNAGFIQMVNLAPFIVTNIDSDVEEFRKLLPNVALYSEITHCSHYGKLIETGVFDVRKITNEIILSAAHSFLERGCDGISTFNFNYLRDSTTDLIKEQPKFEPDLEVLNHVLNQEYLKECPKHYVLTDDRYSQQLPVRLNVEDEKTFKVHIADDLDNSMVRSKVKKCILRVRFEGVTSPVELEALISETPLLATSIEGEIFSVPNIAQNKSNLFEKCDFEIPITLLRKGWNEITIRLITSLRVTLERLEVAIIR